MSRFINFTSAGCRGRRKSRHGYVLLLTLALLVIAALAEAGLARRSLQSALQANEAQRDLQHRWAAASCRQLLEEQADAIFLACEAAAPNQSPRWPTAQRIDCEFTIGGLRAKLALADEDVKLNLNAIYARNPADLQLALLDHTRGTAPAQLRPDLGRDAKLRKRWFTSWGQVFDLPTMLATTHGWERLSATTGEMTCWGEGKPNIRRASDRAIETMAATVVSRDNARKLVEARRKFEGDLLLPQFLPTLDLRRTEQIKLRGVLADRSRCYSLQLALGNSKRTWYHLWIVGDRGASGPGKLWSFQW